MSYENTGVNLVRVTTQSYAQEIEFYNSDKTEDVRQKIMKIIAENLYQKYNGRVPEESYQELGTASTDQKLVNLIGVTWLDQEDLKFWIPDE